MPINNCFIYLDATVLDAYLGLLYPPLGLIPLSLCNVQGGQVFVVMGGKRLGSVARNTEW